MHDKRNLSAQPGEVGSTPKDGGDSPAAARAIDLPAILDSKTNAFDIMRAYHDGKLSLATFATLVDVRDLKESHFTAAGIDSSLVLGRHAEAANNSEFLGKGLGYASNRQRPFCPEIPTVSEHEQKCNEPYPDEDLRNRVESLK